MKRPPLAHKIIGAGKYVPAIEHITSDHLRRKLAAERKRIGPPEVTRVELRK